MLGGVGWPAVFLWSPSPQPRVFNGLEVVVFEDISGSSSVFLEERFTTIVN